MSTRTVLSSLHPLLGGWNDVAVTTNGHRIDPLVGWLTNTDLASPSLIARVLRQIFLGAFEVQGAAAGR